MKAWGGILEISEGEMLNRNFGRILNNLENFYEVNADQIKILNDESFYQNVAVPSVRAQGALQQIRRNNKAYITEDYARKPRKLRKHLLELKEYFSSFNGNDDSELKQQSTKILKFTEGLLLILKAVWR